jgi:hypothetical protein
MSTRPHDRPLGDGDAPLDEAASDPAFVLADLLGTMQFVARALADTAASLADACRHLEAHVSRTVAGLDPEQRKAYEALVRGGATPLDALVQLGL